MERIAVLLQQGMHSGAIADMLGIDKRQVDHWIIDNVFVETRRKTITKHDMHMIVDMRHLGNTIAEIADRLHVSCSCISRHLRNVGIRFDSVAAVDRSGFTDSCQLELIERFSNGDSARSLARRYGLNVDIVGKFLKANGIVTNVSFDNTVLDVIDTEEKAYWLGFLYADGCVSKTRNEVELSLQPLDVVHLVKLSSFVKTKRLPKLHDNRCRMTLVNRHFKMALIRNGCPPCKSLVLSWPRDDVIGSDALRVHFLRGYFDGDGSLSYSRTNPGRTDNVTIRCSIIGTHAFLLGVWSFCASHGIKGCLHKCSAYRNDTWTIGFSKRNSVLLCDMLYGNCNVSLDRKRERYMMFRRNGFAVHESDLVDNDRAISAKAKDYIHANAEITLEDKRSKAS